MYIMEYKQKIKTTTKTIKQNIQPACNKKTKKTWITMYLRFNTVKTQLISLSGYLP